MSEITVSIPDHLLLTLNLSKDELGTAMKLEYAARLFAEKRLSLGQAAALSGKSVAGFMDFASEKGIPVINHDPQDIRRELEDLASLKPA